MKKNQTNPFMKPLTADEENYLVKEVINILDNSYDWQTSSDIIEKLEEKRLESGFLWKTKGTDDRIRKIINWIRGNGIRPVIATSNGYKISDNPADILEQIQSMRNRIESMEWAIKGLQSILSDLNKSDDPFGIDWD